MNFEGLQRRAAARSRGAAALEAALPAYFVVFDMLQQDGEELLRLPYRKRRRRLEVLFSARAPSAPWTLCPMATDMAEAGEWLESWTDVSGVEGLVVKNMTQPHRPAARGWTKIRRRDTTEAIPSCGRARPRRPDHRLQHRHRARATRRQDHARTGRPRHRQWWRALRGAP
ncbi:hypothetical protein [Streptomyces sp. ISL-43]|uniref:ATP-dependent DNA ligase n=1 Tax=Streptomyces sp. ISL-43 TaxID=2819183 RepID=UPI0035A8F471